MAYEYKHPRPALTVDCVVFGLHGDQLEVLLIERDQAPFAGRWALPGGFVHMDESLESAARRELEEETNVRLAFLEQLYTFGDVGRDPRGRVVTVAYYGLVKRVDHTIAADTDARSVGWFDVHKTPSLAFDHKTILKTALARLQSKLRYRPIGFELLPRRFTLSQLQRVYEIILERPLDKRNFRKKILATGLLIELDEFERDVPRRAARLHQFDKKTYRQLERDGFDFEI